MSKRIDKTPIRGLLRERSTLQAMVKDGLDAVERAHRGCFDPVTRTAFSDSLELDEAMRVGGHGQDNRWDYLLGHSPSEEVIAIEPHSAKQDEITTVIRKRRAALEQLADHLRAGARVSKWFWVASGKVQFANTEKAKLMLDQNGIEFVGTRLMAKHLPAAAAKTSRATGRRKPR